MRVGAPLSLGARGSDRERRLGRIRAGRGHVLPMSRESVSNGLRKLRYKHIDGGGKRRFLLRDNVALAHEIPTLVTQG